MIMMIVTNAPVVVFLVPSISEVGDQARRAIDPAFYDKPICCSGHVVNIVVLSSVTRRYKILPTGDVGRCGVVIDIFYLVSLVREPESLKGTLCTQIGRWI